MPQGSLKNHLTGLLTAGAVVAALIMASAAPATAHAAVVGSDPEDGATLETAPETVSVTISELLDAPSTEIAVTDPAGEVLELADTEFDGDTFIQPMAYTDTGDYTLAFRVISEDGHRVDGSVEFTVESIPDDLAAGGADTEPTDEPTEAEATTAEAEPTDEPSEAAAADEEESNSGTALAMILLAALVVVIGGVVLVKLLGRRSDAGPRQ